MATFPTTAEVQRQEREAAAEHAAMLTERLRLSIERAERAESELERLQQAHPDPVRLDAAHMAFVNALQPVLRTESGEPIYDVDEIAQAGERLYWAGLAIAGQHPDARHEYSKLWAESLAAAQAIGIHVYLEPGPTGGHTSGLAYVDPDDGSKCIQIHTSSDLLENAFVLWHEVGHHLFGVWKSSTPNWCDEYRADQHALLMLKGSITPSDFERLDQLARDHIRGYLQPMIDAEVTHHIDLEIADWAKCHIPLALRYRCVEQDEDYRRSSRHEISQIGEPQ